MKVKAKAPGGPTSRPRGRPPQISRDQIVAAALEIGMKDLTMAAVARRLGSSPQAFYRWVRDRDELFALVAEALVERVELPAVDGRPWRDWLRELANHVREALLDAPGLAVHSITHYRASPGFLRINERTCEVLVAAGFSPLDAQRTYLTFGSVLLGWLAREDTLRDARGQIPGELEETFAGSQGRYPILEQVAAAAITDSSETRWEHMLTTLLFGLPGPPDERRP
jgi:AcrR family transcriptional regulator